jgi:hypothetical protein
LPWVAEYVRRKAPRPELLAEATRGALHLPAAPVIKIIKEPLE